MRRRIPFHPLFLLSAAVLALSGAIGCNRQDGVHRVGIIIGLPFFEDAMVGFEERMGELGYAGGSAIEYIYKTPYRDGEEDQQAVQDLVDAEVDLIVAVPTEVSIVAKRMANEHGIPVVFTNAVVEGTDLIESIRAPGALITGVRYPGPDLALLRFERMQAIVPAARRVLVPYAESYPIAGPQLEVLRPAAAKAGITLIEMPLQDVDDLAGRLEALIADPDVRVDAILALADPIVADPSGTTLLDRFARERHIPLCGILASGGTNGIFDVMIQNADAGRRVADIVDKILQGEPPLNIPVVSAETFFYIDLGAVDALGLTVPEGVLAQADRITR
ncbi:MAG: ABC transporter substrate-binding protein [Rhodothermales bacterium]